MKKFLPLILLAVGLLYLGGKLLPARSKSEFDLAGFSRLPALLNGRLKPLDTVARSSLLIFQGRQSVVTPSGQALTPIEWLLDVLYNPKVTDTYHTFEIVHPELLAVFDLKREDAGEANSFKRFAFNQLSGKFGELDRQFKLAQQMEPPVRTPFQRAVIQLYGSLTTYQRLKYTLTMPESEDFLGDLRRYEKLLPTGAPAVRAKMADEPHDAVAAGAVIELLQPFSFMARTANILVVPPDDPVTSPDAWQSVGQSLVSSIESGGINSTVYAYAGLGQAWRQHQPQQFNQLL